MKMVISNWIVEKLSISKKNFDTNKKIPDGKFSLDIRNSFAEDGKRFFIGFGLTLDDPTFDLFVEAVYAFDVIEGVVDENFKKSAFPRVNAPAIAFPYLRAMVSTITLQAGLRPVILPSINFASKKDDEPITGGNGSEEEKKLD